jgi:hypothetical protein
MLDERNLQTAPDTAAESRPETAPDTTMQPGIGELIEQLTGRRVAVRRMNCTAGTTAGGVTLPVAVGALRKSSRATEQLLQRVTQLVGEAVPLTLSLGALGEGDSAINLLEDLCAGLKRALSAANQPSSGVGLSLPAHTMPLQAFLLVGSALLGDGPRYALLDDRQLRHHDDRRLQEECEQNWSFLWRRRAARPALLPVYAASVTTRCPLLDDEPAIAVLPELAIQVPAASAWLPLEINLRDFSDGRGRLAWDALQHALRGCVHLGDRMLEQLVWPETAQRADAWLNRRLAVLVSGIGDLVVERGADPTDLRTLQWLDRLMLNISKVLWSRSQALARKIGPLPALVHSDPTAGSQGMARKNDWHRRWRRALANSAVRHRNLLVLSPYSVLPAAEHSVSDFIDLLPALHHADAFSFANPRSDGCRNADEFATFHRRAFAVMQRRNAASLIAAGV